MGITFNDLGKYGRIGNQMFQIAGTIGVAVKNGYEFGFPHWMNYDHAHRFKFSEDIDIQKWFKNPLPVSEPKHPDYNIKWGYHDVSIPDNVSLKGHFQSEKYFLHCQDLIRHYFEFKQKDEDRCNTIAIHIRFGDYGGDYHPICSAEYYERALAYFPLDYKVLVFSDEPEKAKNVFPSSYEFIEGNHSIHDLMLMTTCDNHIIANSTYSWWGAWLANSKQVIAPRKWFGPACKAVADDIYCKEWIVL